MRWNACILPASMLTAHSDGLPTSSARNSNTKVIAGATIRQIQSHTTLPRLHGVVSLKVRTLE